MVYRKILTKDQALQKVRHYCAYQERSHFETREKLYSLGLRKQELEEVIANLIEENYLNEERFAIQFAGGKFRTKNWGREKIKFALKEKRVSDYCIKKAMKEIDEADYEKTLEKLARDKWDALKGENLFIKLRRTRDYLLQKGYEPQLINSILNSLQSKT